MRMSFIVPTVLVYDDATRIWDLFAFDRNSRRMPYDVEPTTDLAALVSRDRRGRDLLGMTLFCYRPVPPEHGRAEITPHPPMVGRRSGVEWRQKIHDRSPLRGHSRHSPHG